MQERKPVPEIAALAGSAVVGIELPAQDGHDTASIKHGLIHRAKFQVTVLAIFECVTMLPIFFTLMCYSLA